MGQDNQHLCFPAGSALEKDKKLENARGIHIFMDLRFWTFSIWKPNIKQRNFFDADFLIYSAGFSRNTGT